MLLRTNRLISLIPRALSCSRAQQVRMIGHKRRRFNKQKLMSFRDNEWIGSTSDQNGASGFISGSKEMQELQINNEASVFRKDEEFKLVVEESYNHLKQNISLNKFLYKHYHNIPGFHQSAEQALDKFKTDFEAALNEFKEPENSVFQLEELISPHSTIAPILMYNTLTTNPVVESYFKKKNIEEPMDRAYQIMENAYHAVLFTFLSANLPARKLGVDISNPAEWFPQARKLRRKLILHVGPTNSGKTYHALKRLKESNNGYYAGPLRLLAREIYERFKAEGTRCNLVTGEEVIQDLDEYGMEAPLSSGTVEMVSTSRNYEVVVLDEIQMLGDRGRGWAWTNALLGVHAKEVHLCGEESVIPLIKKIASITGDEVFVNKYERLGKLSVEEDTIRGLEGLKKGDCIVAFSKKRIWAYKEQIQTKTKLKCGVIYGALPAEVRSTEAAKFNRGEYDILVASDAIGMGLNLSINRVIFDNHSKFNGVRLEDLESPHVKQIGGRAGRFKVAPSVGDSPESNMPDLKQEQAKKSTSVGLVGAFFKETLEHIRENISKPTIFLDKAIIWPSDEIWTHYTSEFPAGTPFTTVIQAFEKEVKDVPLYAIADTRDRISMGEVFTKIPNLLIDDQLRIGTAPLGVYVPLFADVIYAYSETIARGYTKSLLDYDNILPFRCLKPEEVSDEKLGQFEELHKYVLLFLWMNNRYPSFFVDRECAVEIKDLLEAKIEKILKQVKYHGIGRHPKKSKKRFRSSDGAVSAKREERLT